MLRLLSIACLASCVLLAGCPRGAPATSGNAAASGDLIVQGFSDEALVTLLDALGYEPTLVDTGSVTFGLGPGQVLLFNQWEGDLQLYYVMTGGAWEHEAINEWNRTRRLSRAYIDREADLVLEADLLAVGGLTERQVASFVAVFRRALELFVEEIVSEGVQRTDDPPEGPTEPPAGWH